MGTRFSRRHGGQVNELNLATRLVANTWDCSQLRELALLETMQEIQRTLFSQFHCIDGREHSKIGQ